MKTHNTTVLALVCALVGTSSLSLTAASLAQTAQAVNQSRAASKDLESYNPTTDLTSDQQLKAGHQPLLWFTAVKGQDMPVITITNPQELYLKIIKCAADNPIAGHLEKVKTPRALKELVPVAVETKYEFAKKHWWKGKGYRRLDGAPLAAIIEDFMNMCGLIKSTEYKGRILVDEYAKSIPMIFTLDNVTQLRMLQEYFIRNQVMPLDKKPFLILHIVSNPMLSPSDVAFWSTFFDIKSRADAGVSDFLTKEYEYRKALGGLTCNKYLANTLPEVILLEGERAFDDLKTIDVMYAIAVGVVGKMIMDKFNTDVTGAVKGAVYKKLDDPKAPAELKDDFKTVLQVAGGLAAAYAIYCLMTYQEDASRGPSIEEADEEQLDRATHEKEQAKAKAKSATVAAA